jgi:glycosyltransferase involved in cell wall biosynthesis
LSLVRPATRSSSSLRIAQVAPLYESVPPKLYGGTERVVSYLTEELVRQGHDVTLFASGDSQTRARLVPCCPQSLRLDRTCVDELAHHIVLLARVSREADRFDIIHFHVDYLHFPLSRRQSAPHVTTLHGRLDLPDLRAIYDEFADVPVVSISDAQRAPLPQANWQGTVYHGLPRDLYTLHDRPGTYLAFLGRMSPEKGVERAIALARRTGLPLKMAAKVDTADRQYFDERIRPLLDDPLIEFVGEIAEDRKCDFLGKALALVMPVDWPEPFGLVMIEAMGCGTPVIAWRRGSVPEIVDDGLTGFIVDDLESAMDAVDRAARSHRRRVRAVFEARFPVERMAREYLAIYERLLDAAWGGERVAAVS